MTSQQEAAVTAEVLLLEGQNDLHVVRHILDLHKSTVSFDPDRIDYRDMQGFPELLKGIDNAIDSYTTVGMVVDANSDHQARWEDVMERLEASGVQPPPSPDPQGTVIPAANRSPKIGVWLMPDNASPGELEDFIYEMIPQEEPSSDPVWPRAQAYIAGIPEEDRKFDSTPAKVRKAEVHAWLAARRKPGLMGMAIAAGDLDTTGELCQRLLGWLQRLYS